MPLSLLLCSQVHVFVTHLSLSAASQEKSVVELWKYMSRFSGYKLLVGDLNAEPDSPAIRFLRGEVNIERVFTDRLRDTWIEAGHKSDLDGLTFSSLTDRPTKRIDYIFHQPHSSELSVTSASIMEEGDHRIPPCSDHYGVVATIGWSPPT
jgi:endonuclease/exonuclease/phosphatase family metal-dependent hydrolase